MEGGTDKRTLALHEAPFQTTHRGGGRRGSDDEGVELLCVCVRACACVCVRVCACERGDVRGQAGVGV